MFMCPYCFARISDNHVHFRSVRVNTGENPEIPDDFDDAQDFRARYRGANKEDILRRIEDWEFFAARPDERYESFWKHHGGQTTEFDPNRDRFGVAGFQRKVIDPFNSEHRVYLKKQTDIDDIDAYLIHDRDGFVCGIELDGDTNREVCTTRVCPECHNPLPNNYGKGDIKFVSIIGIQGSGKTIYLSQLLRRMRTYASHVGLAAVVNAPSVLAFLENNAIDVDKRMPAPTPPDLLQQPLFYELDHKVDGKRRAETFVLYDVAGESFEKGGDDQLLKEYAEFVQRSDGIILLVDPRQFTPMQELDASLERRSEATTALDTIHNLLGDKRDESGKCTVPLAVCMSQADLEVVQAAFDQDLASKMLQEVEGVRMPGSPFFDTCFNGAGYNEMLAGLRDWFNTKELNLATHLDTNYSEYSYFAFTALGCDVETRRDADGMVGNYPIGPILPTRIEEPLLWLFHKLGYIRTNMPLLKANEPMIRCPECGCPFTFDLPAGEPHYVEIKVKAFGLFTRTERIPVDRYCFDCGHRFLKSDAI